MKRSSASGDKQPHNRAEAGTTGPGLPSPTNRPSQPHAACSHRAADWTEPDAGELRPEIVHRTACLADTSRPGRSISWIGWIFWVIDNTLATAARLREAVVDAI